MAHGMETYLRETVKLTHNLLIEYYDALLIFCHWFLLCNQMQYWEFNSLEDLFILLEVTLHYITLYP